MIDIMKMNMKLLNPQAPFPHFRFTIMWEHAARQLQKRYAQNNPSYGPGWK